MCGTLDSNSDHDKAFLDDPGSGKNHAVLEYGTGRSGPDETTTYSDGC